MGQQVTFASNGDSAQGYLALPEARGPGVVVIQEWWGLVPHIESVADRLANSGFVALAPDLYRGRTTTDPAQAEAFLEALERAAVPGRLAEAVRTLRARVDGGPVGVLGWSLGGMFALLQAAAGNVDAAAVYYAALEEDDAARVRCPVLLHLAEVDEFDPPEFYERFVATLREAGTELEVHTWPGTQHSFANRDVALHAPEAAAGAWSITVRFLRQRLLGG